MSQLTKAETLQKILQFTEENIEVLERYQKELKSRKIINELKKVSEYYKNYIFSLKESDPNSNQFISYYGYTFELDEYKLEINRILTIK